MAFPADSFLIRDVVVHPPLVLAPLHEITDQPFRRMIRAVGGVGLTMSEMVSSEALVRKARKAEAMLACEGERPFSVQVAGSTPQTLAEAARLAQASGADIVDLNMGCPASNVTKGGAGSALLRDRHLAEACVRAMRAVLTVPFTVKMRAGWDASQKQRGEYLEFLRMFRDQGVEALAIHPRTRAQQYTGKADWSLIARAVDADPGFPIIGNGDVLTPEDAQRMVAETGCQGVMIGRGAMYNPFLFRQIMEPGLDVTATMRIQATIDFFGILLDLLEEREAMHKIKKIGGMFTKGIPNGARFRQSLQELNEPQALLAALEALKE